MLARFGWTGYCAQEMHVFFYKADFGFEWARGTILIEHSPFKTLGLHILAEVAFSWAGMQLSWC